MKNACNISLPAYGLKCYVGLGNTSELKKQKVVECPEEKHYVCMKMYGGGMGDQVRRKCHLINSVSYSFNFLCLSLQVLQGVPSAPRHGWIYELTWVLIVPLSC